MIRKLLPLLLLPILFNSIVWTQPKLWVEFPNIDIGTIYQGEIKKTPIKIKNTGNAPLQITNIQTSCGCTTVKETKKRLDPGESDSFITEFNSAGFRGKIMKTISISSNDPAAPVTNIELHGEIITELEPVDGLFNVWLGSITVGSTSKRVLQFRNTSNHPIAVKKLESASSDVAITLPKKPIQPNEIVDIEVVITGAREGYVQSEFRLELDSKNQKSLVVKLTYLGQKGQ
jgi:hypothetical protein